MIERVQITNFQSLRSVDLRFGRYTVVVGPSSSGKTALMRALRSVASNVRGTHVITRGQSRMAVTVHTGEHMVTLERDLSAGRYRIASAGSDETYGKLAGAVPAAVTAALRLEPVTANGTSVNFAGQFDAPFLLGESGATVARTLGTLTNVTAILEAAREANRRRNAAAADLRTREADLARVRQDARQYLGVGGRLAAIVRAEEVARRAEQLQARVTRCTDLISALLIAERVCAQYAGVSVPDSAAFVESHRRWVAGRQLIRSWLQLEAAADHSVAAMREAAALQQQEAEVLRAALQAAGVCPTCGQQTAELAGRLSGSP